MTAGRIPAWLACRLFDVAQASSELLCDLTQASWDITTDDTARCVGRGGRPLDWWMGALAQTLSAQTELVRLLPGVFEQASSASPVPEVAS